MSARFLLDTSVIIWTLEGSSRVSARAKRALFEPANHLFVSVVSVWEIMLKRQTGKLELNAALGQTLDLIIRESPWTTLALAPEVLRLLAEMPLLHKDPFDRLLVAQAQHEELTILTPDARIVKYDVPTLW